MGSGGYLLAALSASLSEQREVQCPRCRFCRNANARSERVDKDEHAFVSIRGRVDWIGAHLNTHDRAEPVNCLAFPAFSSASFSGTLSELRDAVA